MNLKFTKENVKTAIKEDLYPNHNPFDYAIWVVLENEKKNATAIEEEWNKISKEFILKACKSFRRLVWKNNNHLRGFATLSKPLGL